jgi:uncharacterized protein YoxC
VKQHELATLNETREENAELKRTAEALRKKNTTLTEQNDTLTIQNAAISQESKGKDAALDAFYKAVAHIGGSQLVTAVTAAAHDILGISPRDTKPNKRRNRTIQIVPANTKIITQ